LASSDDYDEDDEAEEEDDDERDSVFDTDADDAPRGGGRRP
jgi:hypothetical protein